MEAPDAKPPPKAFDKHDHERHDESEQKLEAVASLCTSVERNLREMGKALNCPLCLSSYQDAVVLPCVHSYCRECLLHALGTNKPCCPLCNTRATKRSINSAPVLNQLVKAYKKALRHFGLAPVQFDPNYVAMTQLAPEDDEEGSANSDYGSSYSGQSSRRRRSESFVDRHHDFQVSKTWQKVYEYREQIKDVKDGGGDENEYDSENSDDDDTPSKLTAVKPDRTAVAVKVVAPSLPPRPPMPANPTATLQWQRQQQDQIIAANRRALIEAAKKRIEPSPVFNLSMQQELGMEHAIDQEVEDRAEEQWSEQIELGQQQEQQQQHSLQEELQAEEQPPVHGETQGSVFLTPREVESHESTISNKNGTLVAEPVAPSNKDEEFSSGSHSTRPQAYLTANASLDSKTEKEKEASINNNYQDEKLAENQKDVVTANSPVVGDGSSGEKESNPVPEQGQTSAVKNQHDAVGANRPVLGDGSPVEKEPHSVADQEPQTAVRSNKTSASAAAGADKPTPTVLVRLGEDSLVRGGGSEDETRPVEHKETQTKSPRQPTTAFIGIAGSVASGSLNQPDNNDRDNAPINDQTSRGQEDSDTGSLSAARASTNISTTNGASTETVAIPFQKGDVVQVQARTWPGVNKLGGVARVTKVTAMDAAAGCYAYDVHYIMGGREKNVDSSFVSWPDEDLRVEETEEDATMDTNNTSSDSRDAATRPGRKSRRQQQTDRLPLGLLAELAAQGFDTTGLVDLTDFAPAAAGGKENEKPADSNRAGRAARKRIKTDEKQALTEDNAGRNQEQLETQLKAKRARNSSASIRNRPRTKTARRAKSAEPPSRPSKRSRVAKAAGRQEVASDDRTNETDINIAAGIANARGSKRKTAMGARKVPDPAPKRASKEITPPQEKPMEVMSNEEKCNLADTVYAERIQTAIESKVVHIIASSLVGPDRAALRRLCHETKDGPVRVKLTESFCPKKTALCILPVARKSSGNQLDIVGECRTVKAMRAALSGMPIVAPEWITLCLEQGGIRPKVIAPTPSMFIRSLPIKSSRSEAQSKTQFGVATIAASTVKNKTLSECIVHLCGEFSRPPKWDVELVLKEAGASTSQQASSASAHLKSIGKASVAPTTKLVFLCDDSKDDEKCGISGALERELKTALQRTSDTNSQQVIVVGFQWLFDSVVAGVVMPPSFYEPRSARAKSLWYLNKLV